MSGNEQTFNVVNGINYGNGTYGKGSAQRYAPGSSPFGSPDLESAYGTSKDAQYETYAEKVLKAQLSTAPGSWGNAPGAAGMNGQIGNVDLTFGSNAVIGDVNRPPTITLGMIDGVSPAGERGAPGGGFVPTVASPGDGNGADPNALPHLGAVSPYDVYIYNNGWHGGGSQQTPGETSLSIGSASTLVHNGATLGYRPGRIGDDDSSGGNP